MTDADELGALLEAFINTVSQPRGRVMTFMAEASVTVPQVILLNLALATPDSTPSRLAAAMKVSLSYVSQMTERLVRLGLAQRTEDAADRRCRTIRVTPSGRTLVSRIEAVRSAEYAASAAALSEATRSRLADVLSQALDEMRG